MNPAGGISSPLISEYDMINGVGTLETTKNRKSWPSELGDGLRIVGDDI